MTFSVYDSSCKASSGSDDVLEGVGPSQSLALATCGPSAPPQKPQVDVALELRELADHLAGEALQDSPLGPQVEICGRGIQHGGMGRGIGRSKGYRGNYKGFMERCGCNGGINQGFCGGGNAHESSSFDGMSGGIGFGGIGDIGSGSDSRGIGDGGMSGGRRAPGQLGGALRMALDMSLHLVLALGGAAEPACLIDARPPDGLAV